MFVWLKFLAKSGLAQKSAVDISLGLAGVGLAGTSVAFATYMIANNDHAPRVNSPEHLGIFAKPVSIPYAGGVTPKIPELDMSPVGTIRSRAAFRQPDLSAERIVEGYRMRGYSQGAALVHGPSGLIHVKAGSEIEGIGRVLSIEARGRSLVVVTTSGLIVGD